MTLGSVVRHPSDDTITAELEQTLITRIALPAARRSEGPTNISSLLRELTKRHRITTPCIRGWDSLRRNAIFNPVSERVERLERVRRSASAAMSHARNHEQTHVLLSLGVTLLLVRQLPIEPNRPERRRKVIAETVVENELAVLPDESLQLLRIISVP